MLIADRTLKLRRGDAEIEIPIRIFAPVIEHPGSWSCRYEIEWPDHTRTMNAAGADAVQALDIALRMIGAEIYTSDYHKSGDLFFEAPGRGYGFPVPANMRDLLIGDDKDYF
jgi:hypothetical protein